MPGGSCWRLGGALRCQMARAIGAHVGVVPSGPAVSCPHSVPEAPGQPLGERLENTEGSSTGRPAL